MTKFFVQNSIGNRFDKINHEKIKNLVSQMAVFTTAFKNRLFQKLNQKSHFQTKNCVVHFVNFKLEIHSICQSSCANF